MQKTRKSRARLAADLALPPVSITLLLQPRGTASARIRQAMPAIVAAIGEGVTHTEIVAQLGKAGLPVPLKTFQSYLYRYRKALKDATAQSDPPS